MLLVPFALAADPAVTTHLDHTVAALRRADVSALTPAQRDRREGLLDVLDQYTSAGQFPHNHLDPQGHPAPSPVDDGFQWTPGDTPVFVDEHGTHCAVGYLLAVDGQDALVDAAVASDNTGYVSELATPELVAWASHNGLSLMDLQRIQPSYGGIHIARKRIDLLAASLTPDTCDALFSSLTIERDYSLVHSGQDGVDRYLPASILTCIHSRPTEELSMTLAVAQASGGPVSPTKPGAVDPTPLADAERVCPSLTHIRQARTTAGKPLSLQIRRLLLGCPYVPVE